LLWDTKKPCSLRKISVNNNRRITTNHSGKKCRNRSRTKTAKTNLWNTFLNYTLDQIILKIFVLQKNQKMFYSELADSKPKFFLEWILFKAVLIYYLYIYTRKNRFGKNSNLEKQKYYTISVIFKKFITEILQKV